jgi:hypothetical protein
MAGLFFDAVERAQLCDLFEELGPGAPTLLAPWTARDLAAHLPLRERDYVAGPVPLGNRVPALIWAFSVSGGSLVFVDQAAQDGFRWI